MFSRSARSLAGNIYYYTITAYDLHGNGGPPSGSEPASTGAGTVDGRRVGQRPTGSYWGGAGEQIDLMSGNLSYTLPLIAAVDRSGLKATFALAYNSQNWRVVSGYPRILGADTGFGFGWQFMLGAITPIYTGNGTVAYTFNYTLDAMERPTGMTDSSNNTWTSGVTL